MARQLWRYWLVGAMVAGVMFLLLTAGSGFAMPPTHATGIALGGDMTVLPRGVEVIGYNPALLGLEDNPVSSMRFPVVNFGLHMGNNSWSLSRMGETFREDKLLTESEKQTLVDEIQGEYLATRLDAYVPMLGFSGPLYGPWQMAVSLDALSWGELHVDKDIYYLGLVGQTRDDFGQRRNFDQTYGETMAAGRAAFAFARDFNEWNYVREYNWLNELAAGFTMSYYYGGAYGKSEEMTGWYYMDVDSIDAEGYVEVVSAQTGGHGYGLDFGVAAKVLNRRGTVSLAFTNLLGQINWSKADRRIYALQTLNGIPLEGMDDFEAYWERNFDSVDSLQEDVSVTGDLPTDLRLSAGWWLVQNVQVVGALRQALDDAPGNESTTRLSGGMEWLFSRTKLLRAGFGVGGRRGSTFGIGYGTHRKRWKTDIGVSWERGLISNSKGFSFGLNMAWFFGQSERDPYRTKAYWQNRAYELREDILFVEPRTSHHSAPGEIKDIATQDKQKLRQKLFLKDAEDDVRHLPVEFPSSGTGKEKTSDKSDKQSQQTGSEQHAN